MEESTTSAAPVDQQQPGAGKPPPGRTRPNWLPPHELMGVGTKTSRHGWVSAARFADGGIVLIRARFRLTLPDDIWVAAVSKSFPDATFRLLTGVPAGDRSLELGEVVADDPDAVVDAIARHPAIDEYESLYTGGRRAITQYEAVEQRLYEFMWGSSLPPEFPVVVENGEMEFDVTATREQFDAVGMALDETGRQFELLSIVTTDEETPLLTERQREYLTVALRRGYFEVPRECLLAELAESLGVDKSTASETIRRGTNRIVRQYLIGHNDDHDIRG